MFHLQFLELLKKLYTGTFGTFGSFIMNHDDLVRTDGLTTDLRRQAVQAGAAVITGQLFTNVLNLAATIVLARMLTPGDFGLVAMVLVFVGFTTVLRDLGLSAATVQREDIGIHQVNTLYWVNVGASALLTTVLFVGAPFFASFYDEPQVFEITQVLAFVALIDGASIQHQALLRRQLRLGALTLIDIFALVVSIAVAVLLAARGFGYWALVWMQLAQVTMRSVLCWVVTGWRPLMRLDLSEVQHLLVFGGFITGSRLLNHLVRAVDRLLIGRFASADQLGVYSKAYNGVLLPFDRISWAVSRVAVPTLSRLQNQPERFRNYYQKAVLLVVSFIFPAVTVLYLEAESAVLIVLGDQWLFAVPLIRILSPVAVAAMLGTTMRWVFVSLGRTERLLRWRVFESTAKIIAIVAGVSWGAIGVAWGLLVVNLMLLLPGLWYCFLETRLRLNDVLAVAWRPGVATIAAAIAVIAFRSAARLDVLPLADVAAELAVFFVAYLVAWLALPNGRATLTELIGLARELRRAPPANDDSESQD